MLSFLLAATLGYRTLSSLSNERSMFRDARGIIAVQGERVWNGYASAPFEVDLVEPTREVLLCRHPQLAFVPGGVDPVTGCSVQIRHRELPVDLSASGDQLTGGSVIVMGTQIALQLDRAGYIITLIHEDFHQLQSAHSAFSQAIARIRPMAASVGWMLDYTFPYKSEKTAAAFHRMNEAAASFLKARLEGNRRLAISAYVKARREAQATMSKADWSYYEFQIGREGIARWTEITVGEAAPDADVAAAARERRLGLETSLGAIDRQGLSVWRRSVFYVLGPIEAEMLTSLNQNWKDDYFQRPFAFGERLDMACKQIAGC